MREKALQFATEAHAGQVRKGSGLPYITHPIAVAEIAVAIGSQTYRHYAKAWKKQIEDTLYVVSLLHDTLEDCDVTFKSLVELFGHEIADYVKLLTKKPDDSYLDSILRIREYEIATAVKIADLTHNLSDLPSGTQRDKYLLAKYILEEEDY
jgi:(p)ppGpp synthase/HD superfamily hydrolase